MRRGIAEPSWSITHAIRLAKVSAGDHASGAHMFRNYMAGPSNGVRRILHDDVAAAVARAT